MENLVPVFRQTLSLLTMVGDILIVLFLIFALIRKIYPNALQSLKSHLGENAMTYAFLIALTATLGSLFFSEIAKYDPCKLCWFQRIFMYPQVVLLGVALWKKDHGVSKYILPLSVIGGLIALYHYLTYFSSKIEASGFCTSSGGVSCTVKYVSEFGYVNIPMMSLTAFILIIILTLFWKKKSNKTTD